MPVSKLFVSALLLCVAQGLGAQTVIDLIKANPAYASCNYNTYPDTITAVYTPAPAGKKPFYFSHYGRHGSRYISSRSGFDIPFKMVALADSLNELTPTGQRVYQEMKLVMQDTEGRWGELTGYGRKQHRNIARRMARNFPEVFHPGARVQAFSTVVPRCIESMGTALIELLQEEPTLQVSQESSQRNQWFMNYQDRELRRQQMTPQIRKVYNEYITLCRKTSTAKVYKSSLNNLIEFCQGDIDTLTFRQINVAWLRRYQNWLFNERNMEVNGANVYLRNLRTIFNYALQNQFTSARYPFKDIDMSTTEPDKRTVEYKKFLEWASHPAPDSRDFYRDLFMLSFYLCGIRPVDLLHVKREQVQEGRLVYCPEKLNGRTKLSIKIEPEAWELIRKYEGKEYLINIMESRTDYRAFMQHWNKAIKSIGTDEVKEKVGRNGKHYQVIKHHGIVPYITIYYSRTLWATYAYNELDIPMDTISQALGHKSGLKVTNFYVKRDTKRVDEANRKLIDHVKADLQKRA